MTKPIDELNPGSAEAVEKGCTCPRIDNHYGKGYGGLGERYGWIMYADCPLHGSDSGYGGADEGEAHR